MDSLAEEHESPSDSQKQRVATPAAKPGISRENAPGVMAIPIKLGDQRVQKSFLRLDTFPSVNPSGCFESDRVIKSGRVLKRTRKTKTWKPVFLVLRPNVLSIYRDEEATKLRHQISLSDLTAVARQKDPKRKAQHVFGLFSSARNFHIDANNEQEAQEWVEQIRREARIDEEEEEMILMSPGGFAEREAARTFSGSHSLESKHIGSSSSEHEAPAPLTSRKHGLSVSSDSKMHSSVRRPSNNIQGFSGNERGSYSDFSDTGFFPDSSLSLPRRSGENRDPNAADAIYKPDRPGVNRNVSVVSASGAANPADEERVIYHGWLYLLKSRRGVRQWKSLWCVLRPKSFILYKNEEEYSALLILQFPQIVNAVEIDAQSRSKKYCFQVITEERNWRFCAMGEEELAKWLGALKSLLAKRKEKGVWEKEEERLKETVAKQKGKGVELRNVEFATAGGGNGTPPTAAPVVTNATNQQQTLPLR